MSTKKTFTPDEAAQIAVEYGRMRVNQIAKSLQELRDRELKKSEQPGYHEFRTKQATSPGAACSSCGKASSHSSHTKSPEVRETNNRAAGTGEKTWEIKKAIIKPHANHSTGTTSGSGVEDVPPSKINPPGKLDAMKAEETPGESSAGELCKMCGKSHSMEKGCDGMGKSMLKDAKGKEKDNGIVPGSVLPEDKKTEEMSHDGSGGDITKGKKLGKSLADIRKLAKSGEALRHPHPDSGGWVATNPNHQGAPEIGSHGNYGTNFTPAGQSIGQADYDQTRANGQDAYSAAHKHLASLPEHHKEQLAVKHGITPQHMEQEGAQGWGMWGDDQPPSWPEFRDSRLADAMSKPAAIPQKTTPGIGNKFAAAGPLISKSELTKAATPPMAMPPSGKNMNTHVPTSKPAGAMAKEVKEMVVHGSKAVAPPKGADYEAKQKGNKAVYVAKEELNKAGLDTAATQPARPGIFGRLGGGTKTLVPPPGIKTAGAGLHPAGGGLPGQKPAMTAMSATHQPPKTEVSLGSTQGGAPSLAAPTAPNNMPKSPMAAPAKPVASKGPNALGSIIGAPPIVAPASTKSLAPAPALKPAGMALEPAGAPPMKQLAPAPSKNAVTVNSKPKP